jgi:hypothetical protein
MTTVRTTPSTRSRSTSYQNTIIMHSEYSEHSEYATPCMLIDVDSTSHTWQGEVCLQIALSGIDDLRRMLA